jgi:phosphoserine phosphatase RsbX
MDMTMSPSEAEQIASIIEWSVSSRTLAYQPECGDAYLVTPFSAGALLAVIDGLGHGSEAAAAARVAQSTLRLHREEPVLDLMQRCHADLRKTRGAVLSIAAIDAAQGLLTWLGVGNVEGILFRAPGSAVQARDSLLLRGGVVGYQLPPLRPVTLPVFRNDTLILATDGIKGQFCEESPNDRSPREIADTIIYRFARATDDALVLVARYLGREQ